MLIDDFTIAGRAPDILKDLLHSQEDIRFQPPDKVPPFLSKCFAGSSIRSWYMV